MILKPHVLIFKKYTDQLINCLPMDDASFIAKLFSCELLLGSMNYELKRLPTRAEKAWYFLDHVIKPAFDIDDNSKFDNLLSVMECCGYAYVEKLSSEIKSEIDYTNNIEPGMS